MRGLCRRGVAALAPLTLTLTIYAAAPPTTPIQDTLYKADGTRFEGVAQIEWKTFQAANGAEVPQNVLSVRIVAGQLRVHLVPTTNALKPAYYTVRYNSEGHTQFIEFWSVPPSSAPLRLSDVRTHGVISSPVTNPPATIAVQDVSGLRTELDLRPARGANWINSRVARISDAGAIESVIGNSGDCVRVDGTAGPCGNYGLIFVDGESPLGTRDGVNTVFTLSATPTPSSSLSLFRNGVLLRQGSEYTLSESTITFAPGQAPANGDSLQAWYRLSSDATVTLAISDPETPQGAVDGVNRDFVLSGIPMPASSLQLYRNGLLQKAGVDYTLAVNVVTFLPASTPQTGDILQATYRK